MFSGLWTRKRRNPIPYQASLDTVLLEFGKHDRFCIRDAVNSVQILGGVGSGKTSGSGRALATAFLKVAGMGGVVFCAKPDEADLWRKLARECGRENDLVFFDASGTHRFNFMDYAQATVASGGFDTNLVELISRVAEAARMQGGRGGKDDQYFRDAANQLLAHALPFLRVAYGTIRLRDLYRFINDAPTEIGEALTPDFVRRSFCGTTMFLVAEKGMAGDKEAERVGDEYGDYWMSEFPKISPTQRAAVVSTLTSTIYPFMAGQLHQLFCTDTTLVPEFSRQGLIIVLDLPTRKLGQAAVVAQQIFKLLWQQAMEREKITRKTRPVFAWIDECQFFLASSDAEHLSVARQQKICNVFLTQDMPTFYARMPDDNTAESLLGKFGTRIFHSTTDVKTAQYMADMLGKVTHYQVSDSVNTSATSGGGTNLGSHEGQGSGNSGNAQAKTRSLSTYQDYDIAPDYLGRELRTGGPENNFCVDAIIVRGGKPFRSSRRSRIKAEFRQR